MKTALVYDRINKWGGAERVLLALHEIFPRAPLYTSVYNPELAPWAKVFDVRTSFLQKISFTRSNHELIPFLMPLAFEQFNFDEFDLVISVTSEAAKGVITKPQTRHICYCLTPTRYLWSGYGEYFKNPFFKFFSAPAISYLRNWDKIAANRPDQYIAISHEVKKRIKKYYNKEAQVIYPPLYINNNNRVIARSDLLKRSDEAIPLNSYFLIVSRLIPVKRIDLAIKACNQLKLPLKIIGTGKEETKLKQMAGNTIEFLGNVQDNDLITYYKNANALINPGLEDFGLNIIEAQQNGTPVIAYKAGGALETVKEGKTGMFFNSQTAESLVSALRKFDNYTFKPADCREQANTFSLQNFKSDLLTLVRKAN